MNMPTWLTALPPEEDLTPGDRMITLRACWQNNALVGGTYDNEANRSDREDLGWPGGKTITLGFLDGAFSSGQDKTSGAWFPNRDWPEYLRYIAMDILRVQVTRQHNFLNQIVHHPQKICRFFVDFDFKGKHEMTAKELVEIAREANRKVASFFVDPEHRRKIRVIIEKNDAKRTDPYGNAHFIVACEKTIKSYQWKKKYPGIEPHTVEDVCVFLENTLPKEHLEYVQYAQGMHLKWNFDCTIDEGRQLIHSIVYHLERMFPRTKGYEIWPKIIDESPWLRQQLRFTESKKIGHCDLCVSDSTLDFQCPGCLGTRRYIDPRSYWPVSVLKGEDGVEDTTFLQKMLDDIFLLVRECSIHTPDERGSVFGTAGMHIPPQESKVLPLDTPVYVQKVIREDGVVSTIRMRRPKSQSSGAAFKKLNVMLTSDGMVYRWVQKLLGLIHTNYTNTLVESIYTTERRRFFCVRVMDQGVHYCTIAGRYHSKSTVRFEIRHNSNKKIKEHPVSENDPIFEYQIQQVCFSKHCENRAGKALQLPQAYVKLLFSSSHHEGDHKKVCVGDDKKNNAEGSDGVGVDPRIASAILDESERVPAKKVEVDPITGQVLLDPILPSSYFNPSDCEEVDMSSVPKTIKDLKLVKHDERATAQQRMRLANLERCIMRLTEEEECEEKSD